MTKIFLNGCCGRMGKVIVNLCLNSDQFEITAGGDIVSNPDYKFPVYSDLKECKEDFDVIIDFSNAKAVPAILDFALERKKPLVCCTTALSEETLSSLDKASSEIGIFRSANMSIGINLMIELCKQATKILYPEFDIEIVEAHHNRKLDAPSGTAMMIADAIKQEMPDEAEYVFERHSVNKARSKKEIGISSIRGGNIVGDHDAMFISDEEIVTISHRAQTRDVFAKGALKAAEFMSAKDSGYFNMSDIIAEYTGE